jgi:hypothetical protein
MLARLRNLASWRSGIRGFAVGIDNCDFALVVAAAVLCLVVISQL